MSVLVIAQHHHTDIDISTLHTITAATKLKGDIHVAVIGKNCKEAAEKAAGISGVSKILHIDSDEYAHGLAENLAKAIVHYGKSYTYLIAPSNTFGKNVMPRVAALLDVAQITDVISVESADTFKRPIYAGNAIATVQSSDPIKILTIRTTAFNKADISGKASIETQAGLGDTALSRFVSVQGGSSDGPDLTSARVVISGGRGLGNAENFKLLESLAKKIGNCAIGASRAAVDAGYISNEHQVGQTGKIVAPELYIAIGISGAIQHLAGMKDSKVIVAINKDENAPIFEIADYGLVGDLFTTLPKLESLI